MQNNLLWDANWTWFPVPRSQAVVLLLPVNGTTKSRPSIWWGVGDPELYSMFGSFTPIPFVPDYSWLCICPYIYQSVACCSVGKMFQFAVIGGRWKPTQNDRPKTISRNDLSFDEINELTLVIVIIDVGQMLWVVSFHFTLQERMLLIIKIKLPSGA